MSGKIIDLETSQDVERNVGIAKAYKKLDSLLTELRQRTIPDPVIGKINDRVQQTNVAIKLNEKVASQLKKAQASIITILERELKIVPKGHYLLRWLPLGVGAFGVPFGVILGVALNNMAFIGLGMPMGMSIGLAIGAGLDKKAMEEGRQLTFSGR